MGYSNKIRISLSLLCIPTWCSSCEPDKPNAVVSSRGKRRAEDADGEKHRKQARLDPNSKEAILELLDNEEPPPLDEATVKKMILQFEKRAQKNQELRIKFLDTPQRFMESEVELNDCLQEMHVLATVPIYYTILVQHKTVQALLQLLSHENTDISISVVDLLQEMTDVDTLTENEEGADSLFDTLVESQVFAVLVQNMERLDENVKEEAQAVHNALGIIENMMELRPELCEEVVKQSLLPWLFKRVKAKMPFDTNKLYCSEILAILLQNSPENQVRFGEVDGIDVLLQQLASYKRHDPSTTEEVEYMENLFNCLCATLQSAANREKFLKGEGLQLMNLMLREKKLSRYSALKVLDHAMVGVEGHDNCMKFIDILGLRSLFPLFMKTPKISKKTGLSRQEMEEHIISILNSLLKNTSATQRQRLLTKFTENDHEKVERLLELHFKYLEQMRLVDEKIERQKQFLSKSGEELTEEVEDQFYLQRLEAGLFTLQHVNLIMLEIVNSGQSSVKQRIQQILNLRGGSVRTIKGIIREYAGNLGDAIDEDKRDEERDRLMNLLDKFVSSS